MSENEVYTLLLNNIETMLQKLEGIEDMLSYQTLPNKEVFNSKEAAIYLELTSEYVCRLARRNVFPSFKPQNGRRFFKRRDLHSWLLSSGRMISSAINEAEKLAILNPGKG